MVARNPAQVGNLDVVGVNPHAGGPLQPGHAADVVKVVVGGNQPLHTVRRVAQLIQVIEDAAGVDAPPSVNYRYGWPRVARHA